MAVSKATRSAGRKAIPHRRFLRFPVKGKTIELVELTDSPGEFEIEIRFEDKTALSFTVEARVGVFTELVDWKTGDYKLLRSWRPVYSRPSRV